MKKLFSMMILTVMFFNYSSLVVEAANPKIQLLDESDKEFYRNIIAKKIYTHDEILKIVKTMNKLKIEKSEFEKNDEYTNRFNEEVKKRFGTEYFAININQEIKYDALDEKFRLSPNYYTNVLAQNNNSTLYNVYSNIYGYFSSTLENSSHYLKVPLEKAKTLDKNKLITTVVVKPFPNNFNRITENSTYCSEMYVIILYTQIKYDNEILYEDQPINFFHGKETFPKEALKRLKDGVNIIDVSYGEYYLIDTKGNFLYHGNN